MKVFQFFAAALLAAAIGAMTGAAFAAMPQGYRSNSSGAITGWEDSTGYHACHAGTDCRIPAEYDLIWVE